jgi:SNF2 family DNA or RNA helicase
MFQLAPETILERASQSDYSKGREYYRNRRIKAVQFNQERLSFNASVLGTKTYEVHLDFDPAGRLGGATCTCPVYNDGWSCCKHIIAVLLLIAEKDAQGFFRELRFRHAAKQIFSFFNERQSVFKTPVRLEASFEQSKSDAYGRGGYAALSLRIGQDRLYLIRDMKKLLMCMDRNEELVLSKNFSYVPSRNEFDEKDQALIDLIREIYESEKLLEALSCGRNRTSVFVGRQVCLTDSNVKRFFELYADTPFKARIHGYEHEAIKIYNQDIPVDFHLSAEGSDLLLNVGFEGTLLPLTADGEYFYTDGRIYKVSRQQSEYLKPFYLAMLYQKGRKLRFIEEDKQRFVSEILPFAEKAGRLVISEQVQSMIENLPLEAEVYLDRSGADITADVKFIYGEHVINPFASPAKTAAAAEKLLIRDIAGEESILDILGSADFKVKDGRIHLTGDDSIYEFVFRLIPKLQEHAAVFYSENLKHMNLRASVSFSARFRLNPLTDMLEFTFDADGIDRSELAGIMASLTMKKKYYQLKNGSFLNLDSREFSDLEEFIGRMDLDAEELQKEFILIPKYRALYLDQNIREAGIHNIERNQAFKEFVQNIREPEDMEFAIPHDLKGSLREYQKFGFKWLKTLDFYRLGGILADDMGLGKTLQLIALLLSSRNERGPKPSLAVVPTSLVFNWCAELDKFAPGLRYAAITGNKEDRTKLLGRSGDFDLLITSYPLIRRDIGEYAEIGFRYCILDEAQHIKNPNSRNARAVKLISAENRFALTGTPMENNLTELWSIFDFVLPGYLYSYGKFNEKYVQPASGDDGYEALKDLGKQIKPFTLRRLKREVLNELPEKLENTLIAELTEEQKKVYMAFLQEIKGEIERNIEEYGFERSQIKILAALTRLRQVCCHPSLFMDNYQGGSGKMLLLDEILQESLDGGHRILLFSQFTGMLQLIRRRLTEEKIEHLYLDGSTPSSERGFLVNSFNEGQGKVFLISLKAGGIGLNLTGADTVIHFDPWWNPAVEDQATDRIYRIGQKKSVYVMKLVTRGTIEEKILKLQEKKKELIDAVIQPGETLLTKMTREDIQALFE